MADLLLEAGICSEEVSRCRCDLEVISPFLGLPVIVPASCPPCGKQIFCAVLVCHTFQIVRVKYCVSMTTKVIRLHPSPCSFRGLLELY